MKHLNLQMSEFLEYLFDMHLEMLTLIPAKSQTHQVGPENKYNPKKPKPNIMHWVGLCIKTLVRKACTVAGAVGVVARHSSSRSSSPALWWPAASTPWLLLLTTG